MSGLGQPAAQGGTYTSHGVMTGADIDEYRRDTDWYEAHPRVPEEDECEHGRQWIDDCDDCRRPLMVDEIREALTDEASPIYLYSDDRTGVLRQILGAATVNDEVFDVLRQAVEDALRPRQKRASAAVREAAEDARIGNPS